MKKRHTIIVSLVILLILGMIGQKEVAMAKTNQIILPPPCEKGSISLEEVIAKRRSRRSFLRKDLSLEQISQLLWAAQGITEMKKGFSYRSAPSAGALYPMEIYLLTKEGTFHYLPERHAIETVAEKDLRSELAKAALGQNAVGQASIDIIICADYSRVTTKYKERGLRYADMEAGHIAQNIHLQAVSLGLGSVPIGAFIDEEVKRILLLPKNQDPIYIIPVGYPDTN